jgi:Adenylate and Guanylate cyclase catalytic domain
MSVPRARNFTPPLRASKQPGGAEIELSLLFADVRGSTSMAERMPPDEYSLLIARFYGAAAGVIDERDGIVDKFVGDSAVALFIPGFADNDHAAGAIGSARALLEQTRNGDGDPRLPVGAAVHTGAASQALSVKGTSRTSRCSAPRSMRRHACRRTRAPVRSSSAKRRLTRATWTRPGSSTGHSSCAARIRASTPGSCAA